MTKLNASKEILLICIPLFAFTLFGCQQQPVKPNPPYNTPQGFAFQQISSSTFQHWLAVPKNTSSNLRCLTVYLEGDGTPFLNNGTAIAPNPTGIINPLLQLAREDQENAVWLGRPCYFGLHNSRNCSPHLWTFGRYSNLVAASLQEIIDTLADDKQVIIVGHSGGGVLATIIAAQYKQVTDLVTLAAPLDIDNWTSSHQYSRLYDSINPARLTITRGDFGQLHLTGSNDIQVTSQHLETYLDRNTTARHKVLSGVNHQLEGLAVKDWLKLINNVREASGCN